MTGEILIPLLMLIVLWPFISQFIDDISKAATDHAKRRKKSALAVNRGEK